VTEVPSKNSAARRRGSLLGVLVFAAIVTTFTAVCAVQIIIQAWAKPDAASAAGASATSPLLPESR
jgi:hypothetical protein